MHGYFFRLHRLSAALLVSIVTGILPAGASENIVVDTNFVESAVARGAIIWDVRDQRAYARGHIPGAINIGAVAKVLRNDQTEDYIAIPEIERILGTAGLDATREVVLYGDKAHTSAYFGYVTLRYLGASNAFVYHGGIDDWVAAGKGTATDAVKLPEAVFTASPDSGFLIGTEEVVRKVGDASVQIIDARTPREYAGEDIRALRGGHIPGAINIPYQANWVDADAPQKLARREISNKDGMNLKPRESLAAMYASFDRNKETIVYCQSGARASEAAVVLKDLGFTNVRVYDASWLAYGNAFEAPVENVTYFNVSGVNNMIQSLQMQIDTLSEELTTLKSRMETR